MPYTTLVVIALICVSGFVAYIGDLLGRRMGKKRLTLFHLRPRHTAIMVTTITGMVISTLALTVLVSVDPTFRKIFSQGEKIVRQNDQLKKANVRYSLLGKQLKIAIARQERELASALNDARQARTQRDAAKKIVTRLRQEIASRQKELADLKKRKGIAEDELAMRMADLNLARVELRNAQTRLASAQSQLASAKQQLDATKAALEDTKRQLAEAANEALLGNAGTDIALSLRLRRLPFHRGDELARGIIKPAQTDFALKADILALLNQASEKVLAQHAKVGANGRAVNAIYYPSPETDNALPNMNERDCFDYTARQIAASGSDVMVQVVCGMNALAGDQVPVELRLCVNRRVYRNGDRIASTSIDGRESEGAVLVALNRFLRTDLSNAAVSAGLVPASGQDASSMLGPNPEAQADDLLRAVAKIRSAKATSDVSVYATGDIYTIDSLNLSNIRLAVE